MRKMKDIIEEYGISGRLDQAIFRDKMYKRTNAELSHAYEELEKLNLNHRQKKIIDDILTLENAMASRYATLSYALGLRDAVSILRYLRII